MNYRNMLFKRGGMRLIAAALFASCVTAPFAAEAQGLGNLFDGANKKRTDEPTKITALTMDIDLKNNIATLIGSVIVDDQQMTIHCSKMLIFLEDKSEKTAAKVKQGKKAVKSKKEKKTEGSDVQENKQVSRIEFYGNVVITRKLDSNEAPDRKQVATGDKAIFDSKANTIELIGQPASVQRGNDKLNGKRILMLLNEGGRTKITDGTATISNLTGIDSKKKGSENE